MIRLKEEEKTAENTAKAFNLPYENLAFKPVQREALEIISEDEAREGAVAITHKKGEVVHLAMGDPENPRAQKIIEDLKKRFRDVLVFVVSRHSLEKAWSKYPQAEKKREVSGNVGVSEDTLQKFREKISTRSGLQSAIEETSQQKDASIILELLLAGALSLDASDIHIEPQDANIRLRLRIDGLLRDIAKFDERAYRLLLSRIKLLSELKLNVHNVAQDGRFAVDISGSQIQIRTSILPGEYGENIVMRILNPESLLSVKDLGIREDLLRQLEEELKKPNGMVLATGPTGSGKTTTLYAFLKKLKTPEVKIITIEDPIEYRLEGISQTQIVPEQGYTFASGLQSVLRQDPDVILVGEIRDLETADTALQAALTGHLVLSTLHTNDAAGVIPRLVDIGASPSTIGPALNMAIAQRLVRRLCKECKTFKKATPEELEILSKELGEKIGPRFEIAEAKSDLASAKGCEECDNAGYKGRVGIYEIFIVTPEFEKFILNNPSITEIREFAKEKGMTTLRQDGLLKVKEGLTTIEEIERITGE